MKTAQQAATNWKNSAARAAQAWDAGVQAYTGDWAAATVGQEQTMLQNLTQSIVNGRWRQGVLDRGTSGWKQATQAKSANFAQGFTAGEQDFTTSITKIMNALGSIVPNLPPRGDYAQNKLRSTTLMDALHAQRGQLGAK